MKYRFAAPLGAFLLTLLALSNAARSAPPPVMAFGNLPTISDVEVSPDGRHLAMLQSVQGKTVAAIYRVGAPAGTKPAVLNTSEGDIRSVEWAGNDRLLVWMSTTQYIPNYRWQKTREFWRIVSVNLGAQDAVFLFKRRNFNYSFGSGTLLNILPDDPDHVLMSNYEAHYAHTQGGRGPTVGRNTKDNFLYNVYRVNFRTGETDRIENGQNDTNQYLAGPSGTIRVRIDEEVDRDGRNDLRIYANGPGGGRLVRVASYDGNFPVKRESFVGFGDDPNKLYVAGWKADRSGLYAYDLTSKAITETKFLHDRYDIGSVLRDPYNKQVVGVSYTEHFPKVVFFDKTLAGLQKALEGAFRGQSVRITSWSRDRNVVALFVEGPGNPGGYFLFDARSKQASPLAARYPSLQGRKIGKTQPISYKARDGLTIPGYLTLPPDRPAKNLPLVVLPHGGPEVRDTQSFDWWGGFYASRGYAVLQPNYRGSEGYGRKFIRAGHGEWGRKMQDDLSDGVRYLAAQGIADPERVCIVGGSYGGYAALAGAALTPDVYACAVSVNGVTDLNQFMNDEIRERGNQTETFGIQYWQDWLGQRISDADKMAAVSPAKHADRVKAPVLLIHGKADTVVFFRQSESMAEALKKAGKPHRLVALEGEDHWLSEARSRIRVLKETEVFLKEHIGQ